MLNLLFTTIANVERVSPVREFSPVRFVTTILIVSLVIYYLGRRLINGTNYPKLFKVFAWLTLVLSTFSFPIIFRSAITAPEGTPFPEIRFMMVTTIFGYIAYVFFLNIYYDFFLGVFKLGKLVINKAKRKEEGEISQSEKPDDSVLRFRKTRKSLAILIGAFILFIIGFLQATGQPNYVIREVSYDKAGETQKTLRIAHLSDVHVGSYLHEEWFHEIVHRINAYEPDLICLTGDFADGKASQRRNYIKILKEFDAPLYYITGNHEVIWGIEGWLAEYKKQGINLLDYRREIISINGLYILIAGIGDEGGGAWAFNAPEDFEKLIEGAPEVDLTILLSHRPEIMPAASEAGFDLVLAGHTHNGQTMPISFYAKLVTPYPVGFFKEKDTVMYVSPGAGFVGPPIRLGVPREVTLLDIVLR